VKGVKQAIKGGRLTEARIAQSVRRILLVKLKYGLISE
jgi:beta-glucosidase-like glycosyl hydrolase